MVKSSSKTVERENLRRMEIPVLVKQPPWA
jgi:hypothetical protein